MTHHNAFLGREIRFYRSHRQLVSVDVKETAASIHFEDTWIALFMFDLIFSYHGNRFRKTHCGTVA